MFEDIITLPVSLWELIVFIGLMVAWIFTLVRQVKKKRWVWFIFTLIFPVLVMIFYWIDYGNKG